MKPWELLDEEIVPDGGRLQLYRRGDEYSIRVDRVELMNSRAHGSEDALAELTCRSLTASAPRVLVGGLGIGFTLAELLRHLPSSTGVTVAELVPAVVRWHREFPLGDLAGRPLGDPRVDVVIQDVAELIVAAVAAYDAIVLDVDNGPSALTRRGNDQLYGRSGLESAHRALRAGGILTVWSAAPDPSFSERLHRTGFAVDAHRARAHGGRGARHWIWVATRGR